MVFAIFNLISLWINSTIKEYLCQILNIIQNTKEFLQRAKFLFKVQQFGHLCLLKQ